MLQAQQAGLEWHEDLQNLAQQQGLKGKKLNKVWLSDMFFCKSTVKPILIGHLKSERKWPLKRGDLLKDISLHANWPTSAKFPSLLRKGGSV